MAASKRSAAAFKRVHDIGDGIPFGQPILVGHHSEKHARADQNRMDSGMRRAVDESNKAGDLAARADAARDNTAISGDDEDAVEKLAVKLETAEHEHARMKAINAAHKRFLKDPGTLDASDLTDAEKLIVRSYKANYSWEPHPYAPYQLQLSSANQKRIKDRIELLQANRKMAEDEPKPDRAFDGGRIVYNAEANRLQILFDAKPDAEVRSNLKSNGFHWSPSEKAWQRQLTRTAEWAAENALGLNLEKAMTPTLLFAKPKRVLLFKAKRPGIGDRMGDFFGDAPAPALVQRPVQVKGYTRSDGTPVTGHTEFRKVRPEETKPAAPEPQATMTDAEKAAVTPFRTAMKGYGLLTVTPLNQPELREGEKLVDVAFRTIEKPIPKSDQTRFGFSPSTGIYRVGVAQSAPGKYYSFAEYSDGFALTDDRLSIRFERIPGDALDDIRMFEGLRNTMRYMWEGKTKITDLDLSAKPAPKPINPAAVKFNDLHPKAQELFNEAWYGKLHGRMVALLDPANKGLRAEFELRSGIKLPRTIKGTDDAVSAWAAVPWSEEKTTNTQIPKDPDERYPALAQAREHARAMAKELEGMDKEWRDIYRENFVWIIEGKTIHLRPGAPGELVDRFNRHRADRKRIAKQYEAAMESVKNLGGWLVKLKDDPVAPTPAPYLSGKTLEPAVESVPEPEPAAAAEAAKPAAADASATPPIPKRTEKRIVTIVSKPQKPGSSAAGYEFGITGGARQPSGPSELAPYDERNFGYTMKLRMAGRDWEPEDYGWAPNAKSLLERIASGLSSAGPVDEGDVVHPELLPLVQKHHAEVQAREDAAKAEQDKVDAERNHIAQLQADVAARMATVKRKKGKADIALSNGVTVHVTGWQHGDYLAHKSLKRPEGKVHYQPYQVTHVPSGKALTSNLPTMESARELAYRAHLTGAKWDGTEEGAKGAFRDALVSAIDGYRERAPIPPDPDADATKP